MKNIGNIGPEIKKPKTIEAKSEADVSYPSVAIEGLQHSIEKNEATILDLHQAILGLEEDILLQRNLLARETNLSQDEKEDIKKIMERNVQLLSSVMERARDLIAEILKAKQNLVNLQLDMDEIRSEIFTGKGSKDLPLS